MKVLLVGDSEAGAVQPYLSAVLGPGETANVNSVVGSRISAWSSGQLASAIAATNPDVVVVFLGTNDYYDNALPNLTPVFSQLPTGRTVWVGPTSVQNKSWPVDNLLKNAMQAQGIPFIDTESLGISLRDGIHPDAAGAKKWLQAIWPVVRQVYASGAQASGYVQAAPTMSPTAYGAIVVGAGMVGALAYVMWPAFWSGSRENITTRDFPIREP